MSTTSAPYSFYMDLLSLHRPTDRHRLAETLLDQSLHSRSPPPVSLSFRPAMSGAPCFTRAGSPILARSDSSARAQWRFAGRAGSRECFSVLPSQSSRASQMLQEARNEERRAMRQVERRVLNGLHP